MGLEDPSSPNQPASLSRKDTFLGKESHKGCARTATAIPPSPDGPSVAIAAALSRSGAVCAVPGTGNEGAGATGGPGSSALSGGEPGEAGWERVSRQAACVATGGGSAHRGCLRGRGEGTPGKDNGGGGYEPRRSRRAVSRGMMMTRRR